MTDELESRLPLRIADASDVPALLDMMAEFNHHEQIAWERTSAEAPLRTLLGAPGLGVIAMLEHAGACVGYGVLTWGFDLEWAGRDAFLTEFFLKPEARGRGLAAPAMSSLLALARQHGVIALHLVVRHENAPALRVYERAGFVSPERLLLTRRLS